jgi:hypothetical protein
MVSGYWVQIQALLLLAVCPQINYLTHSSSVSLFVSNNNIQLRHRTGEEGAIHMEDYMIHTAHVMHV